jgi:hypothetical protein
MNAIIKHSEEVAAGLPALLEQGSLAVSLARAEVDQQITTARAFPRSIARAVQNITTLATLDEASAAECIYALPRGGKPIKGPSVRLAEIIAGQWGNCRVGTRVVHVDRHEKFVEAEGVFHDLETNSATTARVRRRLSTKAGKLFDEDMIVVTGNAACAIAKRNAILGAVPKAVWRKAYEAVEQVIMGDVKTLTERRGRALSAFAAFGVTPERVLQALGAQGEEDVGLEHLGTLTAMRAALKNGEATVEEMFPITPKQGDAKVSLTGRLDALAGTTVTDRDPETGEIIEQTDSSAVAQTPSSHPEDASAGEDDGAARDASSKAASLPAGASDPPRSTEGDAATLIERAREAAMEGESALLAFQRALSPADQATIVKEWRGLLSAAKAADAKPRGAER